MPITDAFPSLPARFIRPGFSRAVGRVVALAWAAACPVAARADIKALFDEGNGADAVDQFPGLAGNGWRTAWMPLARGTGVVSGRVLVVQPLVAGGQYMQATFANAAATDQALGRTYGAYQGLDLNSRHSIEFDWRLDSAMVGFDTSGDYITICDSNIATDVGSGPGTAFLIRAYGATPKGGPIGGFWAVYDGSRGTPNTFFEAKRFKASTVMLEKDTVYHFRIVIDPPERSYTVAISDGKRKFESGILGFRKGGANAPGTLKFNARSDKETDAITFSADNLIIRKE